MSITDRGPRARPGSAVDWRLVRDVAAVVAIVVGAAVVIAGAFRAGTTAGIIVSGVALVAVGVLLGVDRTPDR